MTDDFDLIPDERGFYVHVQYVDEPPRYTIDLFKWDCTCLGFMMAQAKAKRDNTKPNNCQHLEECVFRIRHAGIKLGKFLMKGDIE